MKSLLPILPVFTLVAIALPASAQSGTTSTLKDEEKLSSPTPVGLLANQNAASMTTHRTFKDNDGAKTVTKTTTRIGVAVPQYGYGYPVPYPVPYPYPVYGYPSPYPNNTIVGAPLTQPSFSWEKPAYVTSIPLGTRYYGGYPYPPAYCPPPAPVYYPPYPHYGYGYGYNQSSSVNLSIGNSNFRFNYGSTVRR